VRAIFSRCFERKVTFLKKLSKMEKYPDYKKFITIRKTKLLAMIEKNQGIKVTF